MDKGWIRARNLEIGDLICAKDQNLGIDKIELKIYDNPITVYNLTVSNFHTYVITKNELLVHNLPSPAAGSLGTWYAESE